MNRLCADGAVRAEAEGTDYTSTRDTRVIRVPGLSDIFPLTRPYKAKICR